MKKSLKLLIILVLVFIATDRLCFVALKQLDKNVYSGQSVGKINQFLQLKDSVDLLVFGSSRANHHIDPKLLSPKSYNMGVDATRIGYSATLISTLNRKHQTILVHIDPHVLFDSAYKGNDVLGLINSTHKDDNIKTSLNELFPEEILISDVFNCYSYNGKTLAFLKNYVSPSYNYKSYYGYDPLNPSNEQKEIFQKMFDESGVLKYESNNLDKAPSVLVNGFVDKIIEVSKKNQSKVVFFTSPTLLKNKDVLIEATKAYFKSKSVEYYDFSNFFNSNNLDNWKDYTHLSKEGAEVFTHHLKNNLSIN